MIDILAIDPHNRQEIDELVDLLHQHCTPEECEQLLEDLSAWNAVHAEALRALEESDEWKEVQQWRAFVQSLQSARPGRVA